MDLNIIEIPDLLISELYRDNLLATQGNTASASGPATRRPSPPPADPSPKDILIPDMGTTLPKAPTHPIGAVPRTAPAGEPAAATAPEHTAAIISSPAPPPSTSPAAAPATSSAAAPAAVPISPAPPPSPSLPEPPAPYKYLGRNQKQITVIVQSPGIAFLPDEQLNVLTKMLEACRMNIGDVAIVNHVKTPVVITSLKEQLHPSIVLLFGLQPVEIRLPINFPLFKIQAYDECTFLCAPSLAELVPATAESKLLKSKLWVCLKDLFGV